MIVYQHRIVRPDLRANPKLLYVFGDNLQRDGYGGQAGEMRDEPNAVGIATKKAPSNHEGAFFTDDEYEQNVAIISADFEPIKRHWNNGGIVIVPANGIGTGLSDMPKHCPETFNFICSLGLGGVGT